MLKEHGKWALIEVQIEKINGMGSPKGYPSIISANRSEVGSEREEERRPEVRFNENQEDVPIRSHISHEAHSGHALSPFRGCKHLHSTNLRQKY